MPEGGENMVRKKTTAFSIPIELDQKLTDKAYGSKVNRSKYLTALIERYIDEFSYKEVKTK